MRWILALWFVVMQGYKIYNPHYCELMHQPYTPGSFLQFMLELVFSIHIVSLLYTKYRLIGITILAWTMLKSLLLKTKFSWAIYILGGHAFLVPELIILDSVFLIVLMIPILIYSMPADAFSQSKKD